MLSAGIALVGGVGVGVARKVGENVRLRDEQKGCAEGLTRLADWPMEERIDMEKGCAKLLGNVGKGCAAEEERCAPSANDAPRL